MTVTLRTLQGDEIPEALRREGLSVLFEVEDEDGGLHYREDDAQAARLVVELSGES